MTPSATASWIFDEATMSRGRYWHWFKTPWLCYLLPTVGIFFIAASIYIFTQEDDGIATPWVLLVMGIYLVLRYWIIGIRFRRDIRKNPQFGKEMKWTFMENGFNAHTSRSVIKSDWTGFYQTYVTPDGFLLYPQKGIYYWIPKSAFEAADAAAIVERLLEEKTNAKRIG